jgi:hypothetical protein
MADFWRRLIERMLPWYSPAVERRRVRRTEAIRKRSISARLRAEKVIKEYLAAEAVSDAHAASLIKEVRRGNR